MYPRDIRNSSMKAAWFVFIAVWYSSAWMCNVLFDFSPIKGIFACQPLHYTNNTAMSNLGHTEENEQRPEVVDEFVFQRNTFKNI